MSERAVDRMTAEAFLDWGMTRDRRYELVDGVPVAMAGAKRRHDRIVMRLLGLLDRQISGGPCLPFTADTAVRTPPGNLRRPDAGVDCGAYDDDAMVADAPVLVVEVLSPSTRDFDMFGKLDEYKMVPSLRHIVLIDPDTPQAIHWRRDDGGAWSHTLLEGLDATISIDVPSLTLPLALLYEGLSFQARPRLVAPG